MSTSIPRHRLASRWTPAAALAIACAVTGCADAGGSRSPNTAAVQTFAAGTTMAEIQSRGTLRVGIKYDAPLFGLKDPRRDSVTGFDAEIARLIAKDLLGDPDKAEFVEASSKNRELFLQQRRVDIVVATYSITPEREKAVDFAGPYYLAGKTFLVRKGTSGISGIATVSGRSVCTVEGTTDEEMLRKEAPKANVIVFDAWSLCAEALRDGRIDAILADDTVLLALMQTYQDLFQLAGPTFTKDEYGIGLRDGDTEFRRYLNDLLTRLEKDGSWRAAYERTVGEVDGDVPSPPPIDRN